jgi:hypothetical protein
VKNAQKPKIAISAPTAAISKTPYKCYPKPLCALNVSLLFRHHEIWLHGAFDVVDRSDDAEPTAHAGAASIGGGHRKSSILSDI